jgi:3-oxoadipate enol-lactonase
MKVEVNGIGIHYELSGKKGRPVVVLSHSLCTNLAMWDAQLTVLEDDFQVLRYDTRGHGRSDAPEGPYTLEQLARDVIGLVDRLGFDEIDFIGISMGGMIGQALALNYPDRLHSLVLCDTTSIMPAEAQPIWNDRIETAKNIVIQALVDETLDRWFTPAYLKKNPLPVQRIRDQILSTPVAGFTGCSEAICRLDYIHRLQEIRLPVMIIVGEDDPGTPVSASEAIHARIEGSQLKIIPAARHLCNVEKDEDFNRIVLSYLKEQHL